MKKILYISMALLGLILSQCTPEYDDHTTAKANEGGLVNPSTTAMNYVVGNGDSYGFDLYLNQGNSTIIGINLYKSCFRVGIPYSNPDSVGVDSIPARWSNEVLQESLSVSGSTSQWISSTPLDFAALTEGLTINGEALPASDGDMSIGDYFNFAVETSLADGRTVKQAFNVKVAVSTRFAGKYKLVKAAYYRLGVLTDEGSYWPAETLFESVDAKTYKMIGLAAWIDNELYFQIEGDGTITYPLKWKGVDQILNDQPLITCFDNPTDMANVPCGDESNYIVKDDVEGKDQLHMSFGYYTGGSGPREFYQVMEKIVN